MVSKTLGDVVQRVRGNLSHQDVPFYVQKFILGSLLEQGLFSLCLSYLSSAKAEEDYII